MSLPLSPAVGGPPQTLPRAPASMGPSSSMGPMTLPQGFIPSMGPTLGATPRTPTSPRTLPPAIVSPRGVISGPVSPTSPPQLLTRALPGVGNIPPPAPSARARMPRKEEDGGKNWHSVRSFVAYMFTLSAFVVFAAPTIISLQLGMDSDAAYWIGKWGMLAIAVPIFLLALHFYHVWMLASKYRRRRYIFLLTPMIPAVLFMIIGGIYMSTARHLHAQLSSNECSEDSSIPAKFWMQEAYDSAHVAYNQCLARWQSENVNVPSMGAPAPAAVVAASPSAALLQADGPAPAPAPAPAAAVPVLAALRRRPTLQACPEWEDLISQQVGMVPWKGYKVSPGTLRQHNPDNNQRWQYLANMEINHMCGGFCKPGPALFVSSELTGHMGGACGQFVAFRLLSIMHWGLVVFTIGTTILVLSIPAYLSSTEVLSNMGYKSAVTLA